MTSSRKKDIEFYPNIYIFPANNQQTLEQIKAQLINSNKSAIIFSASREDSEDDTSQSTFTVSMLCNGVWILDDNNAFNVYLGGDIYALKKPIDDSTINTFRINPNWILNPIKFNSVLDQIIDHINSTHASILSTEDLWYSRGEIIKNKAIILKQTKNSAAEMLRLFLESIACFENVFLSDKKNKSAENALNEILIWLQHWEEKTSTNFGDLAIHQHVDIAWLYSELYRLKADFESAYMALRYIASDHEENQKYIDKLCNDVFATSNSSPLATATRQMRTGLLVLKKHYKQAVEELIEVLSVSSNDRVALQDLKKCVEGMEKDTEEDDYQQIFQRAKSYLNLKKYPQAIKDLTFLIDTENDLDKNLLFIYRADANRHEYKGETKALADLSNIKDPSESKRKMLNEWLAELNNSIRGGYRDIDNMMYRAEIHRLLGNFNQALEDIKEPIEYDAENYFALQIRADTYKALGQHELAIADYDVIIANTDDIKCKANRIESLCLSDNYNAAIKSIQQIKYYSDSNAHANECLSFFMSVLNLKIEKQPNNASNYVFRALAKNNNSDYEDGFTDFEKAHQINSEDPFLVQALKEFISNYENSSHSELLRYCGEASRLLSNIESALDFYSKSLDLDPNNDITTNILKNMAVGNNFPLKAKISFILHDYLSAFHSYNEAVKQFPDNSDYQVMRYYLYFKLEKYSEILDEINQYINEHPGNLECVRIRGAIKLRIGDYRGAIKDLETYLEEYPDNAFACLWISVAKARTNDLIGGLKDYIHSLKNIDSDEYSHSDRIEFLNEVQILKPPKSYKTHVLIGKILFTLKRYQEVLDEFNCAKLLEPSVGDGITDTCFIMQDILENNCWENIEDDNNPYLNLEAQRLLNYDCYSDFEENVNNDPNDVFSLSRMAEIKRADKEYQESQIYFEKVLSIIPNHVFSLSRLAEVYRKQKSYDQAILMCDRVLALEPNNTFCLSRRGFLKRDQNNFDSALIDLELCINIEPGNHFAWIQIADIKYTLELFDKALVYYVNASKLKKHDHYISDRIKLIEEKINLSKNKNYSENTEEKVIALELNNTSFNSIQTLPQEQPKVPEPNKSNFRINSKRKYVATLFNNNTINTEDSSSNNTNVYKSKLRSFRGK